MVVSIDPRRVYVLPEEIESALAAGHTLLEADPMGPKGAAGRVNYTLAVLIKHDDCR